MRLSDEDAALFYHLMFSLQYFVCQKHGLLPEVDSYDAYVDLEMDEKFAVRELLFEDIAVIDEYLEANPQEISAKEKEIVRSWKYFLSGNFFVERLLKKYAIFICDRDVFAVLALGDPFTEILGDMPLPVYVHAVLLPFKDQIIYDGLMGGYNVFFGSGVKFDLKEIYMSAKQNGKIKHSLIPGQEYPQETKPKKPPKDWKPEIATLQASVKKLRARPGDPPVISPTFSLVKASLELAETAVGIPDDQDALWAAYEKLVKAQRRLENTLIRME